MKTRASFVLIFLSILFLTESFKKEIKPVRITITGATRNDIALGDFLVPTGFTVLKNMPPNNDNLEKVLFLKDEILINAGKKGSIASNACLFGYSGNFKGEIGQNEGDDGSGVNGMAIWENEYSLLNSGYHTVSTYGSATSAPRIFPLHAFEDMLERTEDGAYVLYNEYSPSIERGYYHLNLYDKNGVLIKREMPFKKSSEGFGLMLTGFLAKSGKSVWFSPRFCNTIYEVSSQGCTPRYEFDFGADNMPPGILEKDFWGGEVFDYGIVGEQFIKIDNMISFDYTFKHKRSRGIFDERTGQVIDFRSIQSDNFSELLLFANAIMPKGENEFVVVLNADRVQSLVNSNSVDLKSLNTSCKGLGNTLTQAAKDGNPALIYFKYKPDATIPKM